MANPSRLSGLCLSLACAFFCWSASASAEPVKWYHNYKTARDEARRSQRPLLLDFGTKSCFWCKQLDLKTFTDPRVAKLLNENYVRLKIDADKHPGLTKALKIRLFPTLVIASPDGVVLKVQPGFVKPDKLYVQLLQFGSRPRTEDVELYQLAAQSIDKGEYGCAIMNLKKVLGKGRNEQIDQQSRALLKQLEDQALQRLALARQLEKQGKREQARELYREVLKYYPGTEAASETVTILLVGYSQRAE